MKTHPVNFSSNPKGLAANHNSGSSRLLSVEQFTGKPAVTNWRWQKRGWLETVNIAGRLYVTPEQQERFLTRAAAGEFAKELHGTCKTVHESAKSRREKAMERDL